MTDVECDPAVQDCEMMMEEEGLSGAAKTKAYIANVQVTILAFF